MARIRTIKPEFWTDESVVELSPLARLLFIGLWNFVDDAGRMPYSPRRIKMQILPADDCDAETLLDELRRVPPSPAASPLIRVYEAQGRAWLQVTNFERHQRIDRRSRVTSPPPPERPEDSTSPAESRRETPKEGKGGEGNYPPPTPPDSPAPSASRGADGGEGGTAGGGIRSLQLRALRKAFPSLRGRDGLSDELDAVTAGRNGDAARAVAAFADACRDASVRCPSAVVGHRMARVDGRDEVLAAACLDPPPSREACVCGGALAQRYAPGTGRRSYACGGCGRSWPGEIF